MIIQHMFQEPFRLILKKDKKNPDTDIFLSYYENFCEAESDRLIKLFEDTIIYNTDEQSQIKIFGKSINIPRKQVAFGDIGTSYKFSGTIVNSRCWHDKSENNELCEELLKLKDKIGKRFGFEPNFVLINKYSDGNQYIGFHSDDEKDLDMHSPIAGISFGSEREMIFKNRTDSKKTHSLLLKNGSAYCMHYPTNRNYMHSIPKNSSIKNMRISLTFRKITINKEKK